MNSIYIVILQPVLLNFAFSFQRYLPVATRGKQQNENTIWRYQENISCKDGLDKGQKLYVPNRSRRYQEEVARIHRRTVPKNLHLPDNHDAVITNLEPDILECEVKWALGSITMNKASGGDGIPMSYFKS